jgi:hypothetical protein
VGAITPVIEIALCAYRFKPNLGYHVENDQVLGIRARRNNALKESPRPVSTVRISSKSFRVQSERAATSSCVGGS